MQDKFIRLPPSQSFNSCLILHYKIILFKTCCSLSHLTQPHNHWTFFASYLRVRLSKASVRCKSVKCITNLPTTNPSFQKDRKRLSTFPISPYRSNVLCHVQSGVAPENNT